jgi:predicted nucleotidyltransferase
MKSSKLHEIKNKLAAIENELVMRHELNIAFVALYGSQNYGLDSELSDIDVQVYVIPSLDDLIKDHKINKEYTTTYGLATVKDIRLLPALINKANPTTLEIMFTDYIYSRIEKSDLFRNKEILSKGHRNRLIQATWGTIHTKSKNVLKEAEGKVTYNSKELAHMTRLGWMLEDVFVNDKTFEDALKRNTRLNDLRFIRYETAVADELEAKLMRSWADSRTDEFRSLTDSLLTVRTTEEESNIYQTALAELEQDIQ